MKLSLTNRLRVSFVLLIALLGLVSLLGVGRLFQVRVDYENMNTRYFGLEVESERIRSAFVIEQAALAGGRGHKRPPERARAYRKAKGVSDSLFASARQLADGDDGVQRLLDRRAAAEAAWESGVAKPALAGKPERVAKQRRLTAAVARSGNQLTAGVRTAREKRRDDARDETRRVATLVGAGLLGAVLAALLLFSGLVNSMRRPLARLVEGARKLAGGDLSTRVETGGPTEIATLGGAFNEMAAALERDARDRDRVERMKDDFLLTVSHELRTPVTSVKGFAEMLAGQHNSLSPTQREAVEAISDSSSDLSTLIDDLLDLARSDAGRLRIEPRPTAVRPLLDRVARRMRPEFARRGQKLTVSAPKSLPPVKADPERIVQVLTNLLANASKYAPEQSAVRIRAEQNGRKMAVEVVDEGPGMSEEELEHAFERFWRADSSETQRIGGSGLGLAIARSLVELHGGEITATSSPGEGTSFKFTLPITRAKVRRASPRKRAVGRR